MSEPSAMRGLAARVSVLYGLDTVDSCRLRLVSIRTRIETNWPSRSGFLRRGPTLDPASQAMIADLLTALPSPLPIEAGGAPVPLIQRNESDLRAVAGRAVDAAMALLAGATLETIYQGEVTMLASYRPEAEQPITVSDPTVGLLVSTIIGTLEAIVERIGPVPKPAVEPAPTPSAPESAPHDPARTKSRHDVGRP